MRRPCHLDDQVSELSWQRTEKRTRLKLRTKAYEAAGEVSDNGRLDGDRSVDQMEGNVRHGNERIKDAVK